MVAGGPRLAWLDAIRERHPLSLHGVAMSLAADSCPRCEHLERLAALVDRFAPARVSEHLAWSAWGGVYRPDLLAGAPHEAGAASRRRQHRDVQDRLRRPIALENPSHYLAFEEHEFDELDFLVEIARRSGCTLLLDVNNVHVSANNLGYRAEAVIDAVPADLITEVHLAGHSADPSLGTQLLIDSHDAPIAPEVWSLYARLIRRIGPRPTLIERDEHVPAFAELLAERDHAHALDGRHPRRGGVMQLADYQDDFAQALLADDPCSASPALAHLVTQPGFAIYRNTVLKGCIDALQANFPAVARLVGDEWFRAAAAVYARRELPSAPILLSYGRTFPEFLAGFEPADGASLPCRRCTRRPTLERGACRSDDDALDPAALTRLAPRT